MAELEEIGRERGIRPVHPAVLMESAGHDDPRNAFSLCGHSSLPVAPRRWAPWLAATGANATSGTTIQPVSSSRIAVDGTDVNRPVPISPVAKTQAQAT